MKRSLAILAVYLLVSAGLLGGLFGGVFWLVQSEPAIAREQRSAPIPPRIAESIERKLVPLPPVVKEPEPIKQAMQEQAMQEAQVALPQTPRKVQIRELAPQPVKRKPRRDERAVALREAPAPQDVSAIVRPVSTARSDSPY
jgi:hypothetical protein